MKTLQLALIFGLTAFTSILFADSLVVVAEMSERPGNVTVTNDGVVFSTIHPLGNPNRQFVQVNGVHELVDFPNSSWQKANGESARDKSFDTPLGVYADSKSQVWVIDMGLSLGKTRLFAFHTQSKELTYQLEFPADVAPKGSFIQDLAVDDKNGFVYLADIANPGLLVVNTKTNEVRRIPTLPVFESENVDMVIHKKLIHFGGKPARVAINPITLSGDKEQVFFGAMNGKTWYVLDAKLLRSGASVEAIQKNIRKAGAKPISDGAYTDKSGNHYFTNLNEQGVDMLSAKTGKLTPLIRDPRLDWADNVSQGPTGELYLAVNQLYKTPAFTGANDEGKAPYFIYKFNPTLKGK